MTSPATGRSLTCCGRSNGSVLMIRRGRPSSSIRGWCDAPLFLTVTQTRGEHSHTDVTMWFVFAADRDQEITPDPAEFSQVKWFGLNDSSWAAEQFDPGMARFMAKLSTALERVSAPRDRPAR